ncbi:mannitol dehydrogenase family protein [Roseospira visakhapatnamensis]|uniref:Fructuronate reductase n=1 Tax=Roseospira visakhapatnamensis TaxID=390880 RepID=A0A7W6REG2_9PROT|nr:mannitol dehydrogenase family protein [Roseospira visakhapatnamensis]MBB4267054.1 fructuronate reductase [Roseospira visakhapatnamensis]
MTRQRGILDPGYDPDKLSIGVLHLGVGAFHRGHQAVYLDDLARQGETGWGILGVNVTAPDWTDAFAATGGRYTVLEGEGQGWSARRIGAMRGFLYRDGGETGLDLLADPALRLVTLTITEKGYCHSLGTRSLDEDGPIAGDLDQPRDPRTAIGYLVEALRRRRAAGLPGLTVASCDNIPDNGRLLAGVVLDYARRVDPALADWIADAVAFPVSMVDRIVPAVDDAARILIAAETGLDEPPGHAMGIVTETFRQWVIEDRFAGPRPPLESVGVTVTRDVTVFEHMKHRILNGAQTALAHLGHLSGFSTTAACMADPVMATFARRFMERQAAVTTEPPGESLAAYVDRSVARLTNPGIHHPLPQIGTDSAFKIGQRIGGATADLLVRGGPMDLHALMIAGWIQYVCGRGRDGRPIPVNEPGAVRFAALGALTASSPRDRALAFLALDPFPRALAADDGFVVLVEDMVRRLSARTPRAILVDLLATRGQEGAVA